MAEGRKGDHRLRRGGEDGSRHVVLLPSDQRFSGRRFALDVKADGSGRLMMAPTADFSGQYWRVVDLGGGKYALHTLYLGDCFSLDVINDSAKETPLLNATGDFSGSLGRSRPGPMAGPSS